MGYSKVDQGCSVSIPFQVQRFLVDFPRHKTILELILPTLTQDTDLAHDLQHIFRVYFWALSIADHENQNQDLVGAAALIHDLVNIPKESNLRQHASYISATTGRSALLKANYTPKEIEVITEAVSSCSWSKGDFPSSRIGAILQDADRLDAIGAIGIMRNMACAQAMSSRGNNGLFYNPEDPLYKSSRPLNDKKFAIDHFFQKLLLLNQGFHTPYAQQEAHRRHEFLLTFLTALSLDLPH